MLVYIPFNKYYNYICIYISGVPSYFLLIKWLLLLNVGISVLMTVFVIVPWEVGQSSCPNLNVSNSTLCPDSILVGCDRLSLLPNISCEDEDVDRIFKTEECWQEYRSRVSTKFDDHLYQPILLVQVTNCLQEWNAFRSIMFSLLTGYCSRNWMVWTHLCILWALSTSIYQLGGYSLFQCQFGIHTDCSFYPFAQLGLHD